MPLTFKETDAISPDELGSFGQSPAASRGLRPVETPLDDIPALALMRSKRQTAMKWTSGVPHPEDRSRTYIRV